MFNIHLIFLKKLIEEINDCAFFGFITPERQERLVNEVKEINDEN